MANPSTTDLSKDSHSVTSSSPEATPPPTTTFSLEISTTDHPPVLLGLDTLSLSLPVPPRRPSSKTTTAAKQTSKIKITNIPTGHVHLLFASASLDASVRSGFWISVPSDNSVKFRWDSEREELDFLPEEDERRTSGKTFDYQELLRLKSDPDTGSATQLDNQGEWHSLIHHLAPADLSHLIPGSHAGASVQTWPISTLSTSTADSLSTGTPDLALTHITLRNTFPLSSIGHDRTKHSLDKSWYLSTLIRPSSSSGCYAQSLLAEFSLVFILASLLGTPCAIQQWKDILSLSMRCKSAAARSETYTYFVSLLELLGAQLRYLGLFSPPDEAREMVLLDSEAEVTSLGELLAAFGQALRDVHLHSSEMVSSVEMSSATSAATSAATSSATSTAAPSPSLSPLASVRQAYTLLAESVSQSNLNWNLTGALLVADNSSNEAESGKLQRRILRGVEGFGYHVSNDGGWSGSESEEEGPVVLDLEGLLQTRSDSDSDGDEDKGL